MNDELKNYEQQLLDYIEGKTSRFPVLKDEYFNRVVNPEDYDE